tara:strand:- start:3150 stop:3407 length:258 start_codon:yes stop_codon:yes gene_type:complete
MTTEERLADLKRKLRARQGQSAYRDNVVAIQNEIARLEAFLKDQSGVTIVEYGMIAALIAVELVVVLEGVGFSLQGVFDAVGNSI